MTKPVAEDAGRLKTFAASGPLPPDIEVRLAPGHTPGHTFYSVTSGKQTLVLVSDALMSASAQFQATQANSVYD